MSSKERDEILLSEEYKPGECNIIYKRHGIENILLLLLNSVENNMFILTGHCIILKLNTVI